MWVLVHHRTMKSATCSLPVLAGVFVLFMVPYIIDWMQKFWQAKSVVVFSVNELNSQGTCGYSLMVNLLNFLSHH